MTTSGLLALVNLMRPSTDQTLSVSLDLDNGQGRKGPVVVRSEVFDQDEAGDTRLGLRRRGLGQLPLVLHDSNFELPGGQLDNDRGGLLARG